MKFKSIFNQSITVGETEQIKKIKSAAKHAYWAYTTRLPFSNSSQH